jgi:hypothetical protein
MKISRLMQRSLPLAMVALISAAPSAFAQQRNRGQEVFEWTGRVDREVQISMRGNRVSTRNVNNSETGRQNSRVFAQLPRQDGQIYVELLNGRGSASVIEQPSARNNYTATVRITDQSRGADDYRLAAYWQSFSNGDIYRGKGNNDDVYDRNRRDGIPTATRNNNGRRDNTSMLHWSGNVDGDLEIVVQNGRVDYRTLSGAQPTSVRSDRGNTSTARYNGQVVIAQNQGRGSVNITQQPSQSNGYTTVIRVRDPQGGYGFYDFDLIMQP